MCPLMPRTTGNTSVGEETIWKYMAPGTNVWEIVSITDVSHCK